MSRDITKAVQWGGHDQNEWAATGATTPNLPPAKYKIGYSLNGIVLKSFEPQSDQPIFATEGFADTMYQEIIRFWSERERYHKFKLLHKRNYLMWSFPGAGKTMTCLAIANKIVEAGGIALFCSCDNPPHHIGRALSMIRAVHPNIPILNIIEDIDKQDEDDVESMLSILDGDSQVDNIVHFATTNYLMELDERFRKRPGRFHKVLDLSTPGEATRRSYIQQIVPTDEQNPEVIEALVKASDGFLFAHMTDLVTSNLVLGEPIPEAAKRLRELLPKETTPELTEAKRLAAAKPSSK